MYTNRALSDFMNVKVGGGDAGGSGGAVAAADVVADAEVGQEVMSNMIHHTEYVLTHLNLSSDFMSRWKGKKQEVQETVQMMVEMQRSAEK